MKVSCVDKLSPKINARLSKHKMNSSFYTYILYKNDYIKFSCATFLLLNIDLAHETNFVSYSNSIAIWITYIDSSSPSVIDYYSLNPPSPNFRQSLFQVINIESQFKTTLFW